MRGAAVILALLPVAAAVWAFAPAKPVAIQPPSVGDPETKETSTALAALDRDAFRAPLWVAPPAQPAPPVAAAPPPPLKLQLLAVVHEGETYKAMLYDPDSDKILVAGDGDTVVSKKIEKVTATGVQIRDARGLRTLALRTDQPGGVQ